MSPAKYEHYLQLAKIINWGRKYPLRFVEEFLGIDLMDYQKYVFMNSWTTPNCLWCMGRGSGKSTLVAPFVMTKSILIPNWQCYIMASTAEQARETFDKIEKISKNQIASFRNLKDMFANEVVKSAANQDGFTHNPSSHQCALYNGSRINSLTSNINALRGKRSNCNIYDESGFLPDELFKTTQPFTTQDSSFGTGGEINQDVYPDQFPNQNILLSSASSVDTYFFKRYQEWSKYMFAGDRDYFVADISSDMVVSATLHGVKLPKPLLTQKKIDDAIKADPENGEREYKNIFDVDGGDGQVIKMQTIFNNSRPRLPELFNIDNKSKYIISYDPAHNSDQSCIVIAKLKLDDNIGYCVEICNALSLIDTNTKAKTPMTTPQQLLKLKQLILDYNGVKKADYENIECVIMDAGAGGGGNQHVDYLIEEWNEPNGVPHRGICDAEDVKKRNLSSTYPNAVELIRLLTPQGNNKNMYFDALVDMLNQGLITFPMQYKGGGTIICPQPDNKGKMVESEHLLTEDEEVALRQIDETKKQARYMHRYKRENGTYYYALKKGLAGRQYDDFAYCLAMIAFILSEKRREHIVNKRRPKVDWASMFASASSSGSGNGWASKAFK